MIQFSVLESTSRSGLAQRLQTLLNDPNFADAEVIGYSTHVVPATDYEGPRAFYTALVQYEGESVYP